jgi:hypothetical protein
MTQNLILDWVDCEQPTDRFYKLVTIEANLRQSHKAETYQTSKYVGYRSGMQYIDSGRNHKLDPPISV